MSDSSRPFQNYALAYDDLYREKDYAAECAFIEQANSRFSKRALKTILDLGCGTGGHVLPLAAKGYNLVGIDLSPEMLQIARSKAKTLGFSERIEFRTGDIASIELSRKFDLVICMFAVLSYQTTNEQLCNTFKAVAKHLEPGGVFVCDFWYGPAVLRDPPVTREKTVQIDGGQIARKAEPSLNFNSNTVEVHYEVKFAKNNGGGNSMSESHTMRYFFLPELALVASLAGLEVMHSCDCCKLDSEPSEKTWTISLVARKRD